MNQSNPAVIDTPEPVVTTAIAEYRPIAKALHDLYTRHAGVVHDCTTTKGMQACREARAEIRTCRTSLEAKRKEIKAPALERCRLIDADAKRITEALLAIEEPLDAQVKAEEEAAEERREAKRKADQERQAVYRRMVERINTWPLAFLTSTAQEIRQAIGEYEKTDVASGPDVPPHYAAEAASAKARALDKLREMLATREASEAEELRLAAERRAELERHAAEEKRLQGERELLAQQHAAERRRLEAERKENEARAAEERDGLEALRQQAVREAAAEQERWAKEQAADRAEAKRRAAEERAELDRQRVEHARIERELAEERARINHEREDRGLAPHPPPGTWPEHSEPLEPAAPSIPPEPYEPGEPFEAPEPIAFQAEAEPVPSDAVVLRDLAHVLERGGESLALYAWIPNRLRAIADRLEALEVRPGPSQWHQDDSDWP